MIGRTATRRDEKTLLLLLCQERGPTRPLGENAAVVAARSDDAYSTSNCDTRREMHDRMADRSEAADRSTDCSAGRGGLPELLSGDR